MNNNLENYYKILGLPSIPLLKFKKILFKVLVETATKLDDLNITNIEKAKLSSRLTIVVQLWATFEHEFVQEEKNDLPPNYDIVIANDNEVVPPYQLIGRSESCANEIRKYESIKTANNNEIAQYKDIINNNKKQINLFASKKINVISNFLLLILSGGKYNKNKTIMAAIEQKEVKNKLLATKIIVLNERNKELDQVIKTEYCQFQKEINKLSEQKLPNANLKPSRNQLYH